MRRLAALTVLIIACSGYGTSQDITSISCYRSWTKKDYTSCASYTFSAPSGAIACDCAATCGNTCGNISAAYEVYWAVSPGWGNPNIFATRGKVALRWLSPGQLSGQALSCQVSQHLVPEEVRMNVLGNSCFLAVFLNNLLYLQQLWSMT